MEMANFLNLLMNFNTEHFVVVVVVNQHDNYTENKTGLNNQSKWKLTQIFQAFIHLTQIQAKL